MWTVRLGTQGVCGNQVGGQGVFLLHHPFGSSVRSLIASNVGMCSDFAEGGGIARGISGTEDGDDRIQEGAVGGAGAASRVREEGVDDVE